MAIAVGDSAEQTFQVTDEVLEHFGAATGDRNPMHFDDAYAATTMFGERIAHGMLTGGFISTMIGMVLPGPGLDLPRPDAAVPRARQAGR